MLRSGCRPPGNPPPLQPRRIRHTPDVAVATAERCSGAAVQKKEPPGHPGGPTTSRILIMPRSETHGPNARVPVSAACAQCPNPSPDRDPGDATGSDASKIRPLIDKLVQEFKASIEFYYRERLGLELLEAGEVGADAALTQAELIRLLVMNHGWVVTEPGTMVRLPHPF